MLCGIDSNFGDIFLKKHLIEDYIASWRKQKTDLFVACTRFKYSLSGEINPYISRNSEFQFFKKAKEIELMYSRLETSQVHVLLIWSTCKEFQGQALIFSLHNSLLSFFVPLDWTTQGNERIVCSTTPLFIKQSHFSWDSS